MTHIDSDIQNTPHTAQKKLSIGAVSKATDIPVETLRTWERRYGFPQPHRTDSGHRKYSTDVIEHLKLIQSAIEQGHRPKEIVGLSLDALQSLLKLTVEPALHRTPTGGTQNISQNTVDAILGQWMKSVQVLDGPGLMKNFEQSWFKLGAINFLENLVTPFLQHIGIAWYNGELAVLHEQFASNSLRQFLSEHWRPLSERAQGPVIVCATLPGEYHVLGLHMISVVMTMVGCRIVFLGCDTPIDTIVNAVDSNNAEAVLLSVSAAAMPRADKIREQVQELLVQLPGETTVILGGEGAPLIKGTERLRELESLHRWGRTHYLNSSQVTG